MNARKSSTSTNTDCLFSLCGEQVTVEDCMYALEETDWDVFSAIKLVKLKQVLSTDLADHDNCKRILLRCSWNVENAVDYLLANPPGQDSPDVVHL